jgi:hypothetical protein
MTNIFGNWRFWLSGVLGLGFLGVYLTALRRNVDEKSQRSLELKDDVAVGDHVLISVTVVKADPATGQLTARIRFRAVGNIAQNAVTPNISLRFLVNNSPGQQVFAFPRGDAMSRIEATHPIEGDINKYPFDEYQTNLWLLMDTLEPSNKPPVTEAAQANPLQQPGQGPEEPDLGDDCPPAAIAAQHTRSIPLSVVVSASTPGMRYTGRVIRSSDTDGIRIHLNLKRAHNLVNVSITVMCMLMGIALSVVAMVLKSLVSRREKLDPLPLSLSIGLIFGLPALRSIQPGVPAVGVLGDYFSFLWAEMFVVAAAIIAALSWVFGGGPKPDLKRGS